MKAKGFILCLIAATALFSCTLTTEQETNLNADMNQLISVRNDGDGLSFMNYTHPIIVKHFKQKGDSIFKGKFQEIPRKQVQLESKSEIIYWNSGYIKSTIANDSLVQAKIQISLIQDNKELDSSTYYYGISTKNASKWTFVSKEDYFTVFPKEMRLFKD